jgi:hyperosmotically inducible periplasmic protein
MRVFNEMLALGLIGVVLAAGPARGAPAGQQTATPAAKVDDSTLRSRIAASFKKNATIAAREIDVDVHEGVVTLKGVVRTAGEKARATQLATVSGVTRVTNEIVVDAATAKSTAGRAIDATEHAGEKGVAATKGVAQKTGDTTKEIAGATAKTTTQVVATTGETITDGWITTKLKTKFFDETLLEDSDIHVDTNDRVVTLKGTVASSAAKARAAVIAGGTEGVTRVVNQLVVKGKS